MRIPLEDYVWAAGIATDLVNTAALVWKDGSDRLPDPAALRAFLVDHALGTAVSSSEADLAAVHALRARLRVVVETVDPTGASALVADAATVTLDPDGARWVLDLPDHSPATAVLGTAAGVGVLGALRYLGPERFRTCDAGCRGLFIDTSRAGRRRYCMPRICGNRVAVAAHRQRNPLGRR